MHPKWCGKSCVDCVDCCSVDESIPCFLDCEHLNPVTGQPDSEECKTCGCLNN